MGEDKWALFLFIVAFLVSKKPPEYSTVKGRSFFGYYLRMPCENNNGLIMDYTIMGEYLSRTKQVVTREQ